MVCLFTGRIAETVPFWFLDGRIDVSTPSAVPYCFESSHFFSVTLQAISVPRYQLYVVTQVVFYLSSVFFGLVLHCFCRVFGGFCGNRLRIEVSQGVVGVELVMILRPHAAEIVLSVIKRIAVNMVYVESFRAPH